MSKSKRYNPLYLDGPLRGQHYEADVPYVYAMQYSGPTIQEMSPGSPLIETKEVRYQMRQVAFTSAGSNQAFVVWVAWCGYYPDPPLFTIIDQLCSRDAIERGEFVDYTPRST